MTPVVVSGLGFATCIGTDRATVLESLRAQRHGFVLGRPPGCGESGPEIVHGAVKGFDLGESEPHLWKFPESVEIAPETLRTLAPHGVYSIHALEQAIENAGLDRDAIASPETGLFCASAGSARHLHRHVAELAGSDWQRSHPLGVVRSIAGTLNFTLGARYGITGSTAGFVSACTSSSHALGYAFDEIALGRQERVLVVAGEDGDAAALLPFRGMRALSGQRDPALASRPFDRDRDGFIGCGGAAAMVLESAESAERRGARPIARMTAWAQAGDGHHAVAPHPEGRGLERAIRLCLERGRRESSEVDWICAHATSTPAGDRAEALALRAVGFGEAPVSSVKGLTGHGLSFSGLLEAAVAAMCLEEKIVPGNAGLQSPDAICDTLNLPTRAAPADLRCVLNNSSGFGGSNVCHLFESYA